MVLEIKEKNKKKNLPRLGKSRSIWNCCGGVGLCPQDAIGRAGELQWKGSVKH